VLARPLGTGIDNVHVTLHAYTWQTILTCQSTTTNTQQVHNKLATSLLCRNKIWKTARHKTQQTFGHAN